MESIDVFACDSDFLPGSMRVSFPVVHFIHIFGTTPYAYFNAKSKPLFEGFEFVKIYKAAEYMVFSPQVKNDGGCFKLRRNSHGNIKVGSKIFANLGVSNKVYKLYKCKQGFAIRLEESLDRSEK